VKIASGSVPAPSAPSRTGACRAALLGLQLLAEEEGLQAAIQDVFASSGGRHRRGPKRLADKLQELSDKRRKLLEAPLCRPELFGEEEQTHSHIEVVREEPIELRKEDCLRSADPIKMVMCASAAPQQ